MLTIYSRSTRRGVFILSKRTVRWKSSRRLKLDETDKSDESFLDLVFSFERLLIFELNFVEIILELMMRMLMKLNSEISIDNPDVTNIDPNTNDSTNGRTDDWNEEEVFIGTDERIAPPVDERTEQTWT